MSRSRAWWILAASAIVGATRAGACGGVYVPPPFGPGCGTWELRDTSGNLIVSVSVSACGGAVVCINPGLSISVTLSPTTVGEQTVQIDGGTSFPAISEISVSSPGAAPVRLTVGSVSGVQNVTRNGAGALLFAGDILGNLGTVNASAVGAKPNGAGLTVGGSAIGNITLDNLAYFGPNKVGMDVAGDLVANITAPDGAIGTLSVGGAIGAPGSPVTIRAGLDIGSIIAKEIHANITAGWNGPSSNIQHIETRVEGGYSGNLTGVVSAASIGHALNTSILSVNTFRTMDIAGSLGETNNPAVLNFSAGIDNHGDGSPPRRAIEVGHSFSPGSQIVLPANGLRGQVVINRADVFGNWLQGAQVFVGSRILTTPIYSDTPAQLGGGSVGVARFDLHGAACTPPNGAIIDAYVPSSVIIEDPTCAQLAAVAVSVDELVVRHYGPVIFDETILYQSGHPCQNRVIPPFIIESTPLAGGAWTDISSQFYAMNEEPTGLDHTVRLRRCSGTMLTPDTIYRVRPTAALKCQSVTAVPQVADYVYTFAVRFKCDETLVDLFDLDGSNTLGLADMNAWLVSPADVTRDGATSGQDLTTLGDAVAEYQSLPQN